MLRIPISSRFASFIKILPMVLLVSPMRIVGEVVRLASKGTMKIRITSPNTSGNSLLDRLNVYRIVGAGKQRGKIEKLVGWLVGIVKTFPRAQSCQSANSQESRMRWLWLLRMLLLLYAVEIAPSSPSKAKAIPAMPRAIRFFHAHRSLISSQLLSSTSLRLSKIYFPKTSSKHGEFWITFGFPKS